jgi:tRNA 2-thiouridine synthesizing protein E
MPDTMNEVLHPNLEWERDPNFPHAPEFWTQEGAREQASASGIELGEEHLEVLRALQYFFAKHRNIGLRELHDALEERFHAKGGLKYLYTLFPTGPVAQGCKLAGLELPVVGDES